MMDKDEHVKEVYAHFGLAIYLAQVLEFAIGHSLVYLDLIPQQVERKCTREQWMKEYESFMDRHFEKTLGRMMRSLQSVTNIPEGLESLLRKALVKRNWLAHEYFRERAVDFMNEEGRNRMIQELQEAQSLFEEADNALENVFRPVREKYGITDEWLKEHMEEWISQYNIDL